MMCKTKRPIMILTIALTLFLAWGITGTGKKAQALCDLENTTGITVYENVILSEHEKENYRNMRYKRSIPIRSVAGTGR